MAECISIFIASWAAQTQHSNILPYGPLFNCLSLVVCVCITTALIYIDWFYIDPQLISNIRSSSILIPNIKVLATTRTTSPVSSVGGTPHSHHSQHSYQETETNDGQGEIQLLSRRILDFVDLDLDGLVSTSVPGSNIQPGSSVSSSHHDELRRSIRDAFSPGSHR